MNNGDKENIKVKKKPVILWEFWMDPFDNIDKMNLANETEEEELENLYSGAYEEKAQQMEEDNIVNSSLITKKPFKIAITQIGAIPFYENTLPSRIFKFWNGHTNFSISRKVVKAIEETDGVETIDVFTKYRMRISVGKAFNSREVRKKIQENVFKLFDKKEKNGV